MLKSDKFFSIKILLVIAIFGFSSAWAVQKVDLAQKKFSYLSPMLSNAPLTMDNKMQINFKKISHKDSNKGLHVQYREYFGDYPIWDALVDVIYPDHQENESDKIILKGSIYENFENEFSYGQQPKEIAENYAIVGYQKAFHTKELPTQQSGRLLIYVDKDNKAHLTYFVKFRIDFFNRRDLEIKTSAYIIDVSSLFIYKKWPNFKSKLNRKAGY